MGEKIKEHDLSIFDSWFDLNMCQPEMEFIVQIFMVILSVMHP